MIREAAAFVDRTHKRAFGKSAGIPHIARPMETAVTVPTFADDEEIIAAILLHDVTEDAGVAREGLEGAFGPRVADLVVDESKDKGRNWQERKTRTVRHLHTASWEIKILASGDKLSNMRCTARDYLVVGDVIQQRFNEEDERKHTRYYWGIAHALKKLEDHLYSKEYVMLCRTVSGEDIISSSKDMIQGEYERSGVGKS